MKPIGDTEFIAGMCAQSVVGHKLQGHLSRERRIKPTGEVDCRQFLIGYATGKSTAVNFLSEHLKTHHPETFQRVIATENVDLSVLTEA
jgi:hypothetical protein